MSGTAPDVILEPRLGARKSARRQRVTVGSDVVVWVDVRDDITDLPIAGATGVSALYWLPGTRDDESAAQPLEAVETLPGTWRVVVPATEPGTYSVWFFLAEPMRQATEIVFDVSSVGQVALTSTGTPDWGAVQSVAAAAAVSAALPEARRVGADAGAGAAKPFAESAQTAAGQARGDRVAAETAAERARNDALNIGAIGAGTAIPVDAYADLPTIGVDRQAYLVLSQQRTYRWYNVRPGIGTAGYADEGPTTPAVYAEVLSMGLRQGARYPGYSYVSHDDFGDIADTISEDGREHIYGLTRLAVGTSGELRVENVRTGSGVSFLPNRSHQLDEVATAPDAARLLVDQYDTIGVVDRRDGRLDNNRIDASNLARPALLLTRRAIIRQNSVSAAGVTCHRVEAMEAEWDLVRLVWDNDSINPYTVSSCYVAPTADINAAGGYQPVDAGGNAVPWTQVTFNAAGADSKPTDLLTGAVTSLVVPASPIGGAAFKSYGFSDWARVPSIAPANPAAQVRFLAIRTYFATAGRAPRFDDLALALASPYAAGRINPSRWVSGDYASGGALPTTTVDTQLVTPATVQVYSRAVGFTLLTNGDSITQGTGSTSGLLGWALMACLQVTAAARPVALLNGGWGGQDTASMHRRAITDIDLFRPSVITIATFSPNDGTPMTAEAVSAALGRALSVADYARSRGVVPILVTPIPLNRLSAAEDAWRMRTVTALRAMAASGRVLVFDMDAVVSDGATPARIVPAFNADNVHLNDLGNRVCCQAFVPVLARALGI